MKRLCIELWDLGGATATTRVVTGYYINLYSLKFIIEFYVVMILITFFCYHERYWTAPLYFPFFGAR